MRDYQYRNPSCHNVSYYGTKFLIFSLLHNSSDKPLNIVTLGCTIVSFVHNNRATSFLGLKFSITVMTRFFIQSGAIFFGRRSFVCFVLRRSSLQMLSVGSLTRLVNALLLIVEEDTA